MKRFIPLGIALLTMMAPCAAFSAQSASKGGLIPPPAINIPFGGKVVTEINIGDGDVLGIIKQAVPAFAQAVQDSSVANPSQTAEVAAIISKADIKGFMEAINGIKSIRVVIVQYGRKVAPATLIDELNTGIGKLGNFSKVISDYSFSAPAAFALYAEPNNQGYIGYAYEPRTRTLYAGRVVGFVDVQKLTKWGWNLAQMFMVSHTSVSGPESDPAIDAQPEPEPQPAIVQ